MHPTWTVLLCNVLFGSARKILQHCQLPNENPAIFFGVFGIFRYISEFLFTDSTIYCGTPDDVLRNRGWEDPIFAVSVYA